MDIRLKTLQSQCKLLIKSLEKLDGREATVEEQNHADFLLKSISFMVRGIQIFNKKDGG